MLTKLIQMTKQEGMFDTAFLLASKYNLESQLFNTLKGKHNITLNKLKEFILLKEKYDYEYLDICYNLTKLNCSSFQINDLDTSKNLYLKWLDCSYTKINNLDISKNINLVYLNYSKTLIKEIDLSKNVNLILLECYNNKISHLDLSNNVNLSELDCSNNRINHLDLSNNVSLTKVILF